MATGLWEPHTAGIDWCESNYLVTSYIAEFCNTVSALPLAVLALHGLSKSSEKRLASQFKICYLCMFVVSLGTVAFHATLSWQGQMLYELPNIWSILIFLYSIMAVGHRKQKFQHAILLGAHSIVTSVVYTQLSFKFFVCTYCFSLVLLVCWSMNMLRLMHVMAPERESCASLFKFAAVGFTVAVCGLWVPEIWFCQSHPRIFQTFQLHALYNVRYIDTCL